jgi:hypothetical protein
MNSGCQKKNDQSRKLHGHDSGDAESCILENCMELVRVFVRLRKKEKGTAKSEDTCPGFDRHACNLDF